MAPLLTAALITRDESKFLEGCLESLVGIVDEIVVVDTGSVDDTTAIATHFGARLFHYPWNGDFAAARNQSLEAASGQWILYIDADERLVNTDRAKVEQLLVGANEVAFRILFRPRPTATPYREYRLWRNDPRIRFEGVIHEKVVPAIHRVALDDDRIIANADLMLVHLGYEGDQTKKHHRNLPLLRQQLEVEPDNLFARHHLARILEALGEPNEAEDELTKVVTSSRLVSIPNPVASLSYADLIRLRSSRGEDTSGLVDEALQKFPENCVLLWIAARQAMQRSAYEEAINYLDQILATDWVTQPDDGPSYDQELVGEFPWSTKPLCLFRLGRYADAAKAYAMAASFAPGNPTYRVKEELAAARARRFMIQ